MLQFINLVVVLAVFLVRDLLQPHDFSGHFCPLHFHGVDVRLNSTQGLVVVLDLVVLCANFFLQTTSLISFFINASLCALKLVHGLATNFCFLSN